MKQFDPFDPFDPFEMDKGVRRIMIVAALLNGGCLLVSVGGITCVILGCLRLFGVI